MHNFLQRVAHLPGAPFHDQAELSRIIRSIPPDQYLLTLRPAREKYSVCCRTIVPFSRFCTSLDNVAAPSNTLILSRLQPRGGRRTLMAHLLPKYCSEKCLCLKVFTKRPRDDTPGQATGNYGQQYRQRFHSGFQERCGLSQRAGCGQAGRSSAPIGLADA